MLDTGSGDRPAEGHVYRSAEGAKVESSQTICKERRAGAGRRQLNILQTVVSSFHDSAGPEGPDYSSV